MYIYPEKEMRGLYTDTKCNAWFHFTDGMTQDERLSGGEKDAGMGAELLHR